MNRGAVFDLQLATLEDTSSTYKKNSALKGGSIACWSCTIVATDLIFKDNKAISAGAIFIESNSNLTADFTRFESNEATIKGGALILATSSYFTMTSSKFVKNYADSGSAIAALETNSRYPFLIKSCLFS